MKFDCVFCKIAGREIPADIVREYDDVVVFKDINPKAPIHLLAVPKRHLESINDLKEEDEQLIGRLILNARKAAREEGFDDKGYKLVFNVGRGGGQIVDHIHLHILSGDKVKIGEV